LDQNIAPVRSCYESGLLDLSGLANSRPITEHLPIRAVLEITDNNDHWKWLLECIVNVACEAKDGLML
jgi:hypothetical protein